jgi:uncharacterized protein (DUF952 family)
MTAHDATAYKILTAAQWSALNAGTFTGVPLDLADGFVHLSTAAQLAATLDPHFAGQTGLVIAAIDLTRFGAAVRWEASRHGHRFPHLYAPLTRDAVIACRAVERDENGVLRLPA